MPRRGQHFTYATALRYLVAAGMDEGTASGALYGLVPGNLAQGARRTFIYKVWDVQAVAIRAGKKPPPLDEYLSPSQKCRHGGKKSV